MCHLTELAMVWSVALLAYKTRNAVKQRPADKPAVATLRQLTASDLWAACLTDYSGRYSS